jgi:hypothetical protein
MPCRQLSLFAAASSCHYRRAGAVAAYFMPISPRCFGSPATAIFIFFTPTPPRPPAHAGERHAISADAYFVITFRLRWRCHDITLSATLSRHCQRQRCYTLMPFFFFFFYPGHLPRQRFTLNIFLLMLFSG